MARASAKELEPCEGPRSRKGAETRSRLLDAAKQIFEEAGFLEARISDITGRAHLSHGSFYHYFDSKEAIFREIAEAQEERLTAPPSDGELRSTPGDSPRERVGKGNRRYLARYRDEARIMGVIEQVSRHDEQVNAGRAGRQRRFADRTERAIRRLQQEGLADERIDAAIAATALGAMVARFAELWLVQGYGEYGFDEAVEQLTLLWSNALGMPDEPALAGRPAGSPRVSARGGR